MTCDDLPGQCGSLPNGCGQQMSCATCGTEVGAEALMGCAAGKCACMANDFLEFGDDICVSNPSVKLLACPNGGACVNRDCGSAGNPDAPASCMYIQAGIDPDTNDPYNAWCCEEF